MNLILHSVRKVDRGGDEPRTPKFCRRHINIGPSGASRASAGTSAKIGCVIAALLSIKSCWATAHLCDGGRHHDEEVVEEAEDGDAREHDQPEPDEDEDLLVHDVDRLQAIQHADLYGIKGL